VVRDPKCVSRAVLEQGADLLRRFHAAGFIHRDLYLSHVFLKAGGRGDVSLTLIDLQRVLHRPWRRRRWTTRDLAQLHFSTPSMAVSPRDRLRFLKRYLGNARLHAPATRRLVRSIERRAARFARREQRRARAAASSGS
jgi:heptose I phosphotransferase